MTLAGPGHYRGQCPRAAPQHDQLSGISTIYTIYYLYYLQQGPREIHQLMPSGVLGPAAQTTDLGRRLETLSPKPSSSSGVGYRTPQIDNIVIKLLLG